MTKLSRSIQMHVVIRRTDGCPLSEENERRVREALDNVEIIRVSMPAIEYGSLIGHHVPDSRLHLARRSDTETRIVCGAMMGLATTVKKGGGASTEPTQHTPWTTDRQAWEAAPNRCLRCREVLAV